MGHVATTAMARWFNAQRGRALGIASLGHAAGEAVLPGLAVVVVALVGWRATWMISASIIAMLVGPVFWAFTRIERKASYNPTGEPIGDDGSSWTRRQVTADPMFYIILPGLLAPAFIVTVTFFHQAHLVEVKGWSITVWAGFFPFFAGSATVFSLIAGWAVDRWSARRLLPVYLLPIAGAMVTFAYGQSQVSALVGMILTGATVGMAQTVSTAVWAEIYGTRYLGSIKAMTAGIMVLATAIGPGGTGWLMDRSVSIQQILAGLAVYAFVMSMVFVVASGQLKKPRLPKP